MTQQLRREPFTLGIEGEKWDKVSRWLSIYQLGFPPIYVWEPSVVSSSGPLLMATSRNCYIGASCHLSMSAHVQEFMKYRLTDEYRARMPGNEKYIRGYE